MGLTDEAVDQLNDFKVKTRGAVQNYLETAVDYGNCGLWDEAIEVLSPLVDSNKMQSSSNPMVYYYLGYFQGKKGETTEASRYYRLAGQMPPDYVFPHRLESIEVLRCAIENDPGDARARYYLGNLLYDNQPEKAIKEWEKSRELDHTFSIVHRNLGLAYARTRNNIPEAVASFEKAVSINKTDPRYYYELDQLYEMQGVSPRKRLALLEKNRQTVFKRDYLVSREIDLFVRTGQYNRAIDLLHNHHFHVREGGGRIHDTYVDAHMLRGQKYFSQRKYRQALQDFEAALEYPRNLEVGKPHRGGRFSQVYYFIATVHQASGDTAGARGFYEKAVTEKLRWSELSYYQGMAYRKLGRHEQAKRLFDGLIEFAGEQLKASAAADYFAKFGERRSRQARMADAHYLIGLGHLGKAEPETARQEFEKALELDAYHSGAGNQLSQM